MILTKKQINGNERSVLKRDASIEDIRIEAERLQRQFGYDVKIDPRRGVCQLSHKHYRGVFILALEPDEGEA